MILDLPSTMATNQLLLQNSDDIIIGVECSCASKNHSPASSLAGVSTVGVLLSVVTYILGVVTVVILQHYKSRKQPATEGPPQHVSGEEPSQRDPMYEDIIPQRTESSAIELEENMAYGTARKQ